MLDQDFLRSILHYNTESGELVWRNNSGRWTKREDGRNPCHYDKDGYLILVIQGKKYKAHRIAWFYCHNEWPEQINHINGVPDDNRLANLEASNQRANCQNRVEHRNGGLVGVRYRGGKVYESYINVELTNYFLGTYDTGEEAHEAHVIATNQSFNGTFHDWLIKHRIERERVLIERRKKRTVSHISQKGQSYILRITYENVRYLVLHSTCKEEVEKYKTVVDDLFREGKFDPSVHCIRKKKTK